MSGIIEVHHSYYKIENVSSIPFVLSNELTKWNPGYFRRENIGFYYDEKKKELRVPRGYPKEILENIFKDRIFTYMDNKKIEKKSCVFRKSVV